jgi:predicted O-methyltransferase YrrM
VRNLARPERLREMAQRFVLELKSGAGRIPPIYIGEIEGIDRVEVPSRLQPGTLVSLIAKLIDAREVFEFGTYKGETTMLIASHCPNVHVVTLDLPDGTTFSEAQRESPVRVTDEYLFTGNRRGELIVGDPASRITQIRMDSGKFDEGEYLGRFDLIYIDASHSYSAVKSDSEKAFRMIRAGGTIIWDDYFYPGVWNYLNELAERRPELALRVFRDWKKVIMPGGLRITRT